MDRGADARVADAEPPFEQRLRAEGADQRDLHGGGHDPPDAEATREGSMNLTKHVQRDAPGLGGWDNAYGRALHRRQRSVGSVREEGARTCHLPRQQVKASSRSGSSVYGIASSGNSTNRRRVGSRCWFSMAVPE